MFLGLRKLGNICCECGHKMFLNKIRNTFCVPDTKFVSATTVAREGKRGNICVDNNVSATMCPRLPGPLIQDKENAQEMYHGMSSPALGWSSGKKAQDIARHEIRLFPLLRIPLLCYICIIIYAFLAMQNIN